MHDVRMKGKDEEVWQAWQVILENTYARHSLKELKFFELLNLYLPVLFWWDYSKTSFEKEKKKHAPNNVLQK